MDAAQQARADRRHRREGVIAAVVIASILGGMLLYGRQSVHNSNEMRATAQLNVLRAQAAFGARMLDARVDGLEKLARLAVREPALVAACAAGDASRAEHELNRIVASQSSATQLSLYSRTGAHLAGTSELAPPKASALPWMAPLLDGAARRAVGTLTAEGDASLAVAVRVRMDQRVLGYLVAWAPIALDAEGLGTNLAATHTLLLVIDPQNDAVALAGAREDLGGLEGPYDEAIRLARKNGEGATAVYPRQFERRKLVGYAMSREGGLVALAAELSEHALAPSRYLVARLFDMVLPTILLVALTGWVLFSFYYHERRLADRLAGHNAELAAAAQAESDFLANVSHDLRTPLAALRLSIASLLDRDVQWSDAAVREALHSAKEQVEQLTGRVRNLLEMSRIEAGAQPLRKEMCDLTDIVDCAVERVRPLLQGRAITRSFPAEPIFVECDQTQIETVVVNLLENALKYSPKGSPLHLSGGTEHPYAVVRVADEGPGVPPGDETRIFEKFYRAAKTGPSTGIGLGLAICKSIVERHGGAIGVRNRPEGGAEFWFGLPVPIIDMSVPAGGMEIGG